MTDLILAKTITQGDTFKAGITVTRLINEVVTVVDLSAVVITSQVRDLSGVLVSTLVITAVDLVNGKFQVRGESGTSLLPTNPPWPTAGDGTLYKWDIQFIETGDTWSMPIRGIKVTEDNTA